MPLCSTCKESKPEEDFNWKVRDIKRSTICKLCHKDYRHKHYLDNRIKYITKARVYQSINGRAHSQQQIYAYEYLLHNFCVDCGENNPILLQYDHKNPELKNFSISTGIKEGRSLQEIIEEIKLCDVRCVRCHTLRTSEQFNWHRWYGQLDNKYKNVYTHTDVV